MVIVDPKNQIETMSVVTESLNAASSDKACENSESTKLAHEEASNDTEAHEEDDYTSVSFETQEVLNPTWMATITVKRLLPPRRIKVSSSNNSTSIHTVPHILFQEDVNPYIPRIVSIGPLHYHRRGQLKAMEEHKWRYINEIITRKGEAWFEQCIVAVKKLEKKARECYSQVIELHSDSFVEMMVLDGCFIVELFCKNWFRQFKDDPLLELPWLSRELTVDLAKLENQIPFFILQILIDLIDDSYPSLRVLALKFFRRWPFNRTILPMSERTDGSQIYIHHLLHLLHENIVFSVGKKHPRPYARSSIQCASKLKESGIKFKLRDFKERGGNLLDIKFEKGIIEIPFLAVEDKPITILRNLIAFEQCYIYCKKYITTYTYFMVCLINSSKDVEILIQKGIIKNELGSKKDVALLFNNINKEVILFRGSFYLSRVCGEINYYCGTAWPKLRATLMRDYFKNPWAVMSITAAVLLLLLTLTQAFFSSFPKFAFGN